jgi:hypothetical protein
MVTLGNEEHKGWIWNTIKASPPASAWAGDSLWQTIMCSGCPTSRRSRHSSVDKTPWGVQYAVITHIYPASWQITLCGLFYWILPSLTRYTLPWFPYWWRHRDTEKPKDLLLCHNWQIVPESRAQALTQTNLHRATIFLPGESQQFHLQHVAGSQLLKSPRRKCRFLEAL